jgi:hypothetical protein
MPWRMIFDQARADDLRIEGCQKLGTLKSRFVMIPADLEAFGPAAGPAGLLLRAQHRHAARHR